MTERLPPSEPPRLADELSEAGELLRSADPEFRKNVDESGAWRRVERARRHRAQAAWAALAMAAAAALALGVGASSLRAERDSLVVGPEPVSPPEVKVERVAPSLAVPVAEAEPLPFQRPVQPEGRAQLEPRDEGECKQLSAAGHIERAVDCFRVLGRRSGITAEVALYEAARLTAEHLRDAHKALGLLDEHRRRFPDGALRGEMEWLRVQALMRVGRHDDALAASEALLATPVGRKLSSELHWLRGQLLQDARGDCVRAVSEFVSLVGEPGPRGDDAELRRAQCLERLGRAGDARAAYEQYLRRPNPARAEEARARLSTLE